MAAMMKMELFAAVQKKFNMSEQKAMDMVNFVFDAIAERIAKGDSVVIKGFGGFHVRHTPARQGFNPKTGVLMNIGAKKTLAFKPGEPIVNALKSI